MDFLDSDFSEIYRIIAKLDQVKCCLNSRMMGNIEGRSLYELFNFFSHIKELLGNFDNDVNYLAFLLAKQYLCSQFDDLQFDESAKTTSASEFDIDAYTKDSKRIIAEIKTAEVKYNNFDVLQFDNLRKDFSKLENIQADYKFIFVTDKNTYEILNKKLNKKLKKIRLVLLQKQKRENEIFFSQFADDKMKEAFLCSKMNEEIFCKAFKKAYENSFGNADNFYVYTEFLETEDEDFDISISFFEKKKVVEDVYVEKSEIELKEAQKIKISSKVGDVLYVPFDKELFSKRAIILAFVELNRLLNIDYQGKDYSTCKSFENPGKLKNYYKDFIPYCNSTPKIPDETQDEAMYSDGSLDIGSNPFPFNNNGSEDNYGDESWP